MAKKPMPFKGKQTRGEEMAEAKAVRSGKMSPAQYARGEKKEGSKMPAKALMKRGAAMKSGKLSPAQYAKNEAKKKGR